MEKILLFIKGFEPCRDFFLNGYCYWFANILVQRFHGTLVYDGVENHFMAKIGDDYYDASGNVTNLYRFHFVEPWEKYSKRDPEHTDRIIRDCILKEAL